MTHLRCLLLQGLATSRPAIKRSTLAAVLTLALRPVQYAGYSQTLVSSYLLSILSIPGLIAERKNDMTVKVSKVNKKDFFVRSSAARIKSLS